MHVLERLNLLLLLLLLPLKLLELFGRCVNWRPCFPIRYLLLSLERRLRWLRRLLHWWLRLRLRLLLLLLLMNVSHGRLRVDTTSEDTTHLCKIEGTWSE